LFQDDRSLFLLRGQGIHDMEEFASFYGKLYLQKLGVCLFSFSPSVRAELPAVRPIEPQNKKPGKIVFTLKSEFPSFVTYL